VETDLGEVLGDFAVAAKDDELRRSHASEAVSPWKAGRQGTSSFSASEAFRVEACVARAEQLRRRQRDVYASARPFEESPG
jgi:hypothetical protein